MKKDLTEIVFILDKSGSMNSIKDDAIGGFNSFLEEQKKAEGKAKMSVILFDDTVQTISDGVDINEVKPLDKTTFIPSGLTSLLDAIGLGIDNLNKRISESPEDEKPSNVIFAIMTDGHENSSMEYQPLQIKHKVESMQKEKDYQFIFLGANIDAVGTAEGLGINRKFTGQFVADGYNTRKAMKNVNDMTTSYRTQGVMSSYQVVDSQNECENNDK